MKPETSHPQSPARWLCFPLLLAALLPVGAQEWLSLQEGDVRIGPDNTTVNTSGTLVTSGYVTHATYIRGYVSKDLNFNSDTNLLLGTRDLGTASDIDNLRLLVGFDLSPVVAYVGANAYTIDDVRLIFTHRTLGLSGASGMALWNTTAFNESTATWNNPGAGAPAGGTLSGASAIASKTIVGSGTQYPSNQVWTAAGIKASIQSAVVNATNHNAYFLLKRNSESDANFYSTYVTDENTDPAYGGIDARPELQVKVTILSNAPLVSVTATDPNAAEPGTDTGRFTISRTGNTTNEVTVNFSYSGVATVGSDYTRSQEFSVVLPPDVTSTNIDIIPLDDLLSEDNEAVVLTITPDANYGIGLGTAAVTIADDNDAGALVQWLFGNTSLPQLWSTNLTANDFTVPGLAYSYSGTVLLTPPGSLWVQGNLTGSSIAAAISGSDYIGVSLSPKLGYTLTLTNLEVSAIYYNANTICNEAVIFVRSSLDNYTNTIGIMTNIALALGGGWQTLSIPLGPEFADVGAVTFRLYVYDDSNDGADGLRIDNLYIRGTAAALPPGAQQVGIAVTDATAAEPADPASFTLTRGGSTAAPLDVYYRVSGTASNGVDYATLSGMATIPAGSATAVINVAPIDDLLQEPTETITLTLFETNGTYRVFGPNSPTATLADNLEPTQVAVVAGDDNAYERVSSLTGWFNLIRGGDTNTSITVNFALNGSATEGLDYLSSITNTVTFGVGETLKQVIISPLDDTLVEPNESVQLTLQSGPGYITPAGTTALVSISSDDLAPEAVLFHDEFETADSATNYTVLDAASLSAPDSFIDYSFDYSTIGVPPAPGSTTTKGLKLTANKTGENRSAAVNLFPNLVVPTNNFALRFDLYLQFVKTNDFAEGALAGINHSGAISNWFNYSTPVSMDGDGQYVNFGNNDRDNPGTVTLFGYNTLTNVPMLLSNRMHTTVASVFNNPPYCAPIVGTNGALSCDAYSTTKTWVDCELSQVDGLVKLTVNGVALIAVTNDSAYTTGKVMLGYCDSFDSTGPAENLAVFDNVRVVSLPSAPSTPPAIASISVAGQTVTVSFSASPNAVASGFKLQSAATIDAQFADDDTAVITGSAGAFQATTAVNGAMRFYRIRTN